MVSEKLFYAENKEDAEKDAKEWADFTSKEKV
jgi:hypothetical protein